MESSEVTHHQATVAEVRVPWYHYNFVKSYLFLLYSGKSSDSRIVVENLVGIAEPYSRRPKPITVADDLRGRYIRVVDGILDGLIRFEGALYRVSVFFESRHTDEVDYYVHLLGLGPEARASGVLLERMLKESVRTSPYQNATLGASSGSDQCVLSLRDVALEPESLDEVFLPPEMRRHLDLFVETVKNFGHLRTPLRYLLSGKPGTGKTKIIRALAAECRDHATFLFSSGAERRIDDLFDTAEMFSPVVLCIDDVDMLTGSRQDGLYTPQLATFLQRLDGFARADQFILATTNDKALVDLAASRPGRFDRILDVSLIEPSDYARLVRSKTSNERVARLFSERVLARLREKRVSGAFIATLVKQLELADTFDTPGLDEEYVTEAILGSYEGFYESDRDGRAVLGFRE